MVKIRRALLNDMESILTIQALCYYAIEPENEVSMASKIMTSPDTCFVANNNREILGYLLAIPALLGEPPTLNDQTQSLDKTANCLYLHDLAIHPDARGKGIAKLLLDQFMNIVHEKFYNAISLVSIQNSVDFWKKQGFRSIKPSDYLKLKLWTYGKDAVYMEKNIFKN